MMVFRPESSKRGRHSFTSMSGGSDLVLKSQSYNIKSATSNQDAMHHVAIFWYLASRPVNEGDTWRFEKPLRCSIDWAYNKPHWTTSFGRSSRSKRWLESRRQLQKDSRIRNFNKKSNDDKIMNCIPFESSLQALSISTNLTQQINDDSYDEDLKKRPP